MKWLILVGFLAAGLLACSSDNGSASDAGVDGTVQEDGKPPLKDGDVPVKCEIDKDAPLVNIGGIFTMTAGGSASTQAKNKDQIDVLKAEVNKGCGLLGDKDKGAAMEVFFRDGQDDKSLTAGLTKELIEQDKVVAMVGAGGSAPTVPSAVEAVKANIPFGIYFSTGDDLTGCTPAELADAAVEKLAEPGFGEGKCWDNKGLVIRTSSLSTVWGRTVNKYAKDNYPDLTAAATVYRDDSFGRPIQQQFEVTFEAGGGTITGSAPYPVGTTKDGFKDILKGLGNPQIIVGVWRIGELKSFMEAYVELAKDAGWTKPSNFDTLRFINAGSVRSDYTDISNDAIKAMSERSVGLEPFWDKDSDGFKKWEAAFRDFDPEAAVVTHTQMRTYDALMILALAIVKANSTKPEDIKAQFQAVANPDGEVVYPGEFAKARALIMDGKEINYEGASGSADLADTGNVKKTPYQVWGVESDGSAKLLEAYESAE